MCRESRCRGPNYFDLLRRRISESLPLPCSFLLCVLDSGFWP